jgi:hypothetical protein
MNYLLDFVIESFSSLYSSPQLSCPMDMKFSNIDIESLQKTGNNFCLVLWNDESHSFDEVITQLSNVLPCDRERANYFAINVDKIGREVVETSPDLLRLAGMARSLLSTKLSASLHSSKDILLQNISTKIITWISLNIKFIFNVLNISFSSLSAIGPKFTDIRIDYFLKYDLVLWKDIRKTLKKIYTASLLLDNDAKMVLAYRLSDLYYDLADGFLNKDRECENNILFFTVQLFTSPSVAVDLVKRDFTLTIVTFIYLISD